MVTLDKIVDRIDETLCFLGKPISGFRKIIERLLAYSGEDNPELDEEINSTRANLSPIWKTIFDELTKYDATSLRGKIAAALGLTKTSKNHQKLCNYGLINEANIEAINEDDRRIKGEINPPKTSLRQKSK